MRLNKQLHSYFLWVLEVLSCCILIQNSRRIITNTFPEFSSGGRCLSAEYTDRVGEVAKKHGLKLHIDGARIFNASVVRNVLFIRDFFKLNALI